MEKITLQLQIGTHRFKVRVDERSRAGMLGAAKRVSRMLEQERAQSKVVDGERAAIMVALRCATAAPGDARPEDLAALEDLLDAALEQAQLQ